MATISLILLFLFDVPLPETVRPGEAGGATPVAPPALAAAVAFGLLAAALAAASFLVLRNKLSRPVRAVIAAVFLLAGIVGAGVVLFASAAFR